MKKRWDGEEIAEQLRAQGVPVTPLGYVRLKDAAAIFQRDERTLRRWLQEEHLEAEQISLRGRHLHVNEIANFLNKKNLEAGDY